MKRPVLFLFLLLFSLTPVYAYKILYAEQWYKLFHRHLYEYPDDCLENISYLEQALKSDFANPLNALGKIKDEKDWEKYRYLFKMHVNLLIIQQYMMLGKNFDKQNAYFYNYPWKFSNLDSLDKAEQIYRTALYYWNEAKQWAAKANELKEVPLDDLQFWTDEAWRIDTADLDYEFIINRQLGNLEAVRQKFKEMGPGTY